MVLQHNLSYDILCATNEKVKSMSTYNTSLLRLAREQGGLSQSVLAARLKVQQALLSKYEHGLLVPTDEMQTKIAKVLNYPKSFFLREDDEVPSGLVFHRKRSSLTAKVRLPLEAEVRARSLDVLQLAKSQNLKSNIIPREGASPSEMAQRLRRFWGCANGPIENLIELLERNNIIVLAFDFKTDKLDGFFMPLQDDIIAIALNTNAAFTQDRRRFTLAHELGHAVLEHFNENPGSDCEDQANEFASEFLLPQKDVIAELKPPLTITNLKLLKSKWRVSMQSLVHRAHVLGTMSDPAYRSTCIYLSAHGFRKREPLCGISEETPRLLAESMQKFVSSNQGNVLNALHLTWERFHERYPQVEGLLKCK